MSLPGQIFSIAVVDMTGRTLVQKEHCTGSFEMNENQLGEGIYTLRICTDGNRAYAEKLVIAP